ncbi:MAG: hypothetical protein ABSG57_13240 [Candidatus Bathyarchaeia archaeon]|jgi:hypothetical protein
MKEVILLLNFKDVRKCRNSVELNEFIEKYAAQGNPSSESFDSIYWNLFEEWKKALKAKPGRTLQRSR